MTRSRSTWTSQRHRQRRGFTLIEVLVALVVGAVVMLGARLLLEGVGDSGRRIVRVAQRADRDANAERLLRSTVASLEWGSAEEGGARFGGDEHEARFTSWCDTPGGWQERCAVMISITCDSSAQPVSAALSLSGVGTEPVQVRAGFMRGELRYLADARDGGHWITKWDAGLSAPIAIGVILDRDTLVLRVGERG
jgi:prepilin-type N-terminal cleavage/methylation domain-containing protein